MASLLKTIATTPEVLALLLFLTVPGPADDRLIGDSDPVDLDQGMHFYSAPRSINPGGIR